MCRGEHCLGAGANKRRRHYTVLSAFSGGRVNPKLNEDDAHLFREAVRDVKPLTRDAPAPETPRPPPRARFTRADRLAVLQESLETDVGDPELASGEELVFSRNGVQS